MTSASLREICDHRIEKPRVWVPSTESVHSTRLRKLPVCANRRASLIEKPSFSIHFPQADVECRMADITLPQVAADALIAMEKFRTDARLWNWPNPGERLAIPLTSADKRESFILDITRARDQSHEGHV